MSAFERAAVQRLIDRADAAGVAVPEDLRGFVGHGDLCAGGAVWAALHPVEADWPDSAYGCCDGSAMRGPDACTCWEPIFDIDQQPPVTLQPPTDPLDAVAPTMCGDCAYRKGSPERADDYGEEALMDLAEKGTPFYCHEGMRRPVVYRHPTLGDVPGDPDDWQPLTIGAVPFRADGRPGLLCAGWTARFIRSERPRQ